MNDMDAMGSIVQEYQKAKKKFDKFHNAHEGYAVILEELDELWEKVKNNKTAQALADQKKEAIQVGAMALRFLIDLC